MMRPKVVEENLDNFNLVADDAMARFVELKEACGPDDHIPDIEEELRKYALESEYVVATEMASSIWRQLLNLNSASFPQQRAPILDYVTHLAFISCWYQSNARRYEFRLSQAGLL